MSVTYAFQIVLNAKLCKSQEYWESQIKSHKFVMKKRTSEFLNSNMRCSLIIGLWVCSQNNRMISKSRFPKYWLSYQLNRWMVSIQLYDSLELVKTFQQWVVGGKRREISIISFNSMKDSSLSKSDSISMSVFLSL